MSDAFKTFIPNEIILFKIEGDDLDVIIDGDFQPLFDQKCLMPNELSKFCDAEEWNASCKARWKNETKAVNGDVFGSPNIEEGFYYDDLEENKRKYYRGSRAVERTWQNVLSSLKILDYITSRQTELNKASHRMSALRTLNEACNTNETILFGIVKPKWRESAWLIMCHKRQLKNYDLSSIRNENIFWYKIKDWSSIISFLSRTLSKKAFLNPYNVDKKPLSALQLMLNNNIAEKNTKFLPLITGYIRTKIYSNDNIIMSTISNTIIQTIFHFIKSSLIKNNDDYSQLQSHDSTSMMENYLSNSNALHQENDIPLHFPAIEWIPDNEKEVKKKDSSESPVISQATSNSDDNELIENQTVNGNSSNVGINQPRKILKSQKKNDDFPIDKSENSENSAPPPIPNPEQEKSIDEKNHLLAANTSHRPYTLQKKRSKTEEEKPKGNILLIKIEQLKREIKRISNSDKRPCATDLYNVRHELSNHIFELKSMETPLFEKYATELFLLFYRNELALAAILIDDRSFPIKSDHETTSLPISIHTATCIKTHYSHAQSSLKDYSQKRENNNNKWAQKRINLLQKKIEKIDEYISIQNAKKAQEEKKLAQIKKEYDRNKQKLSKSAVSTFSPGLKVTDLLDFTKKINDAKNFRKFKRIVGKNIYKKHNVSKAICEILKNGMVSSKIKKYIYDYENDSCKKLINAIEDSDLEDLFYNLDDNLLTNLLKNETFKENVSQLPLETLNEIYEMNDEYDFISSTLESIISDKTTSCENTLTS